MTEDEAKTKVCCGPRSESPSAAGTGLSCLGSICMAWRWDGERRQTYGRPFIEAVKAHRAQHGSDLKAAKEAVEAVWVAPSPTDGFCGLAGPVQ